MEWEGGKPQHGMREGGQRHGMREGVHNMEWEGGISNIEWGKGSATRKGNALSWSPSDEL